MRVDHWIMDLLVWGIGFGGGEGQGMIIIFVAASPWACPLPKFPRCETQGKMGCR